MTSPARESYDAACFASLFAVEERHFWFRARNRILARLVEQVVRDLPDGYRVLDVGCGTGNVLRVLERACHRGRVIGMDLFAEGLRFARRRSRCPLVQADVFAPPFRERFHLAGLFDVLEHLEDDRNVLRGIHALLEPGGALLLTVPAHPWLWSYFDEVAHHVRRYERAGLAAALADAGFRVEYVTEFMSSIVPIVWAGRRLRRRPARLADGQGPLHGLEAGDLKIVPLVNEVLAGLLGLEAEVVARRRRLPVGTSLLALARKDGPGAR